MAQDPTTLRKRRSVVRASITRLFTCLKDLESKADQPTTLDLAQQMSKKLESLDSDFKLHHYALIDLIDDIESMLKEQDILDGHDDETAILNEKIGSLSGGPDDVVFFINMKSNFVISRLNWETSVAFFCPLV